MEGKRLKYSGIGGQAVLEGIMMKNKDSYAVAVRKADGEIAVMKDTYVSMTEKVKLFSLPFIRGVFNFADSMILGMKTLTWSAGFVEGDEEEEEPGKFEKFLIDRFGEKLEEVLMAGVMVVSVFLAIAVFMVLPLLIAGVFRNFIHSDTAMAVIEGLIRIGIFIGYNIDYDGSNDSNDLYKENVKQANLKQVLGYKEKIINEIKKYNIRNYQFNFYF